MMRSLPSFEEHFHRILDAEHFQIAIKRLQFEIQFNPPFEKALLFRVFFGWHV